MFENPTKSLICYTFFNSVSFNVACISFDRCLRQWAHCLFIIFICRLCTYISISTLYQQVEIGPCYMWLVQGYGVLVTSGTPLSLVFRTLVCTLILNYILCLTFPLACGIIGIHHRGIRCPSLSCDRCYRSWQQLPACRSQWVPNDVWLHLDQLVKVWDFEICNKGIWHSWPPKLVQGSNGCTNVVCMVSCTVQRHQLGASRELWPQSYCWPPKQESEVPEIYY